MDIDDELEELLDRAEDYFNLVSDCLHVPPADRDRGYEEVSHILNRVQWEQFYLVQNRFRYQIHFMFPDLTEEQRKLLVDLQSNDAIIGLITAGRTPKSGPDQALLDIALAQYAKVEKQIVEVGLKNRMTPLQAKLVDSDYFRSHLKQ